MFNEYYLAEFLLFAHLRWNKSQNSRLYHNTLMKYFDILTFARGLPKIYNNKL